MLVGATGLMMAKLGYTQVGVVAMLGCVFLLGMHSTFFGPIKYAILPQHLPHRDVLGATGLVEAGTYMAILMGTILAGYISVEAAAIGVLLVAADRLVQRASGRPGPARRTAAHDQLESLHRQLAADRGDDATSAACSSRSSPSASSGRSARF